MRAAARSLASAVAADPDDADAWTGLARALLAITPDPSKGSERYEFPLNASGAAYIAAERAKTAPQRARALAVLGEALKRRSYWRPAIDALAASLAIAQAADVRASYEALRNEHGFRLTNYEVESDMAEPRLCLQFSEGLQRGQVDFSKFISVDGRDPQNVTAEGAQLCVEGLQHGKRYEVLLRAGLPSDVGETLLKASEIGVYVKDRGAAVRFTGRAYVLPSRGQQGIPVVTVNAEKVNVEIYRIGDRSLVAAINNGDLAKQLAGYELSQMRETTGQKVWGGELETQRGKLNEEVSTAIPVGDAIPQLQPGVYAMVAAP